LLPRLDDPLPVQCCGKRTLDPHPDVQALGSQGIGQAVPIQEFSLTGASQTRTERNGLTDANDILHIPPNFVVKCVTAHRKPPEVRICRLRNQSLVGTLPPSTSTPHWPACCARR